MPKFLVTLEGVDEPLLIEEDDAKYVPDAVGYHFYHDGPKILKIVPTYTDEVPPMPEGCRWWIHEPERENMTQWIKFAWNRMGKYIPISEDWHPSFAGNYVWVWVSARAPRSGYMVGVAGGDDDLCNREFDTLEEALAMYNQIDEGTTKEELHNWGFEW